MPAISPLWAAVVTGVARRNDFALTIQDTGTSVRRAPSASCRGLSAHALSRCVLDPSTHPNPTLL